MSKVFKELELQQTEQSIQLWRDADLSLTPSQGWTRTIRKALGMTAIALGKRLGISANGASKIEKSEMSGTITLNSLRRAAEALDCELKYALVPKSSLSEIREQQARKKAKEQIQSANHSMKLEAQGVDSASLQILHDELVKSLLDNNDRELWK